MRLHRKIQFDQLDKRMRCYEKQICNAKKLMHISAPRARIQKTFSPQPKPEWLSDFQPRRSSECKLQDTPPSDPGGTHAWRASQPLRRAQERAGLGALDYELLGPQPQRSVDIELAVGLLRRLARGTPICPSFPAALRSPSRQLKLRYYMYDKQIESSNRRC